MARLLTLLLLVFWGTAYGNVPREATPAPASSVTVNGAAAETNGDFTFAYTNALIYEPYSHFTVIAQNLHVAKATNDMWVSLPSSVALRYDSNGNRTGSDRRYALSQHLTFRPEDPECLPVPSKPGLKI